MRGGGFSILSSLCSFYLQNLRVALFFSSSVRPTGEDGCLSPGRHLCSRRCRLGRTAVQEVLTLLQGVPEPLPPLVILLLQFHLFSDLLSPKERGEGGSGGPTEVGSLQVIPHDVQQSHEVVALVPRLAFEVVGLLGGDDGKAFRCRL
jgi:hypothetical protein